MRAVRARMEVTASGQLYRNAMTNSGAPLYSRVVVRTWYSGMAGKCSKGGRRTTQEDVCARCVHPKTHADAVYIVGSMWATIYRVLPFWTFQVETVSSDTLGLILLGSFLWCSSLDDHQASVLFSNFSMGSSNAILLDVWHLLSLRFS